MELRVLRYFLAVAREQSISGAAGSLHLTQPTLSRQMMELEAELGKQLFLRGSRRITLTQDGELLRKRAEEIVALVEKTETELSSADAQIAGEVHIGSGETEAIRLIARAAKALQSRHQQIRYHLYSGNADDVIERLDKGLLDFGLLIEPYDHRKYDFLKLPAFDTWGVLMRKDSPLAAYQAIHPEQLWPLPLLISRQSMALHDLPSWIGKQPDQLHIVGTYNLLYNASRMVDEGVGYALCLDRLVYTGSGSSLCFRPIVPEHRVGVSLVWKRYQVFSAAAGAFLQALQRILSQEPM